ncbi:aromatic prenyltransferase [Xylaria intraflava]|nr:aromatic prenyltransferase [Xylaria intraflava]
MPHCDTGSQYWWDTTGRDLAYMLHNANYPKDTQHKFLTYYKDILCPLLGGPSRRDDVTQAKSWTWDGSTHEYSFEMKGSSKLLDVRFVADFGELRPVNWENPLSSANTETVISSFASRAPGFDDTWYKSLHKSFDCSHLSAKAQWELIDEAGHLSPLLIGFDILRDTPLGSNSDTLPLMGKAYFIPCLAAAAQKTTRFQAIRTAIYQLPSICSYPNILNALRVIEDYLSTKPNDWENGARFLSTDFISPDKARLKLYLRSPVSDFDTIWDYFTLGGRIPGLDDVKDQYREFVMLLGGTGSDGDRTETPQAYAPGVETGNRRKSTTVYFSLDNRYPFPAPKVAFCARNVAANDALVVKGLDQWLCKYGWADNGTTIEEHVRKSL